MTQISVKLSDEEYRVLQRLRGVKSTSEYIRDLIFGNDRAARKETEAFRNLFSDISTMKENIDTLLKELPNQEGLLAVAAYLTHAMSIGNPTAYAHHTAEMKDLFQKVRATVKNGR